MAFLACYDENAGATGEFAAKELENGIVKMHPMIQQQDETLCIELRLGFPLSPGKDPFWDDGYEISVENGRGILQGSNSRSLLLAVYRLLTEAGCSFLRPGHTFFPHVDWRSVSVHLKEEASYRHRGICLEGAASLENVLDLIDWAPKVGYNSYFTQFMEGYTFFERWYDHSQNPFRDKEGISGEKCRTYMGEIAKAVKRRGMLYHAVGHGWTCEPLGISGRGWEPVALTPTPEQTKHMALVNGNRGLWNGIPLNTNLCYGNAETRELITEYIARYAQQHPEIDVLHFWLADDANNQCECQDCQKARPSDFYVEMLNLLDEKLSSRGLPTKVVFLLYFDLLWPPEREKIQNQDRFLLMFAPITRTFSKPLHPLKQTPELPPYRQNQLSFPRDVEENLAYLKAWQSSFSGDSFDYDYHLISPLQYDLGLEITGRVLYQDIQALASLGLHGLIHCQVQRVGIPHNFLGWMSGRVLWDAALDYAQEKELYFRQAFGDRAGDVQNFLEKASRLFPMEYLSRDRHEKWAAYQEHYLNIRKLLFRYRFLCRQEKSSCPFADALRFYWRLLYRMNNYLLAQTCGTAEKGQQQFQQLSTFLWQHEPGTQRWFDTYIFYEYYRRRR